MTCAATLEYCPLSMEGWQHKSAFVVEFRSETDIQAGQFEGRVKHIAPTKTTRFHSLNELLTFIANVLATVRSSDQL
jgi:hypothetical protein